MQVTKKLLAILELDISARNLNNNLIYNQSIFTQKNLIYTIKTPDSNCVFLNNIQGYIKPGILKALIESSSASKITLLNILIQQKTKGTIYRSILVNRQPISISFQYSAGYIKQLDVYKPLVTVRKALEFSALLYQSYNMPTKEKLYYINTIIDLLELNNLKYILIGCPRSSLLVKQYKYLTISIELVAKLSILIFLNKSISGLNSQATYNTIHFLCKLTEAR